MNFVDLIKLLSDGKNGVNINIGNCNNNITINTTSNHQDDAYERPNKHNYIYN